MRKWIFTTALLALLGLAVPTEAGYRHHYQHRNDSGDDGKAHLIVFRAADFGNTAGLEVWSNGRCVSGVVWGHRVDLDLPAGQHILAATFVPGRALGQPVPVNVELRGGKTYAFTALRDGSHRILLVPPTDPRVVWTSRTR